MVDQPRRAAADVDDGRIADRANLQPTSVNANSFPTPFEYYTVWCALLNWKKLQSIKRS